MNTYEPIYTSWQIRQTGGDIRDEKAKSLREEYKNYIETHKKPWYL